MTTTTTPAAHLVGEHLAIAWFDRDSPARGALAATLRTMADDIEEAILDLPLNLDGHDAVRWTKDAVLVAANSLDSRSDPVGFTGEAGVAVDRLVRIMGDAATSRSARRRLSDFRGLLDGAERTLGDCSAPAAQRQTLANPAIS